MKMQLCPFSLKITLNKFTKNCFFSYWTSPFVLLNVCVQEVSSNKSKDFCSFVSTEQGPGPAIINIPVFDSLFQVIK